jgi:integrase
MSGAHQLSVFKFMTVAQAGQVWLTRKLQEHAKPKTIECCRAYLKPLAAFFGDLRLYQIDAGAVVAYQAARQKSVGASAINHEVNALAQIMRLAACWGPISDHYRPLEEKPWQKPETLSDQEEQLILAAATSDPELELAEIAFTIARNAGICGSELRRARLRDLDLDSHPATFYVAKDDPEFQVVPRIIPLSAEAEQAFRRLRARALALGAKQNDHFLVPFRVGRGHHDPNRPASKSWLRHQTRVLRERTGIARLQPQLYRNQLCTEMLEKGIKPEVVEGIVGRVSQKMVDAYRHKQILTKQEALAQLRGKMIAFPAQ